MALLGSVLLLVMAVKREVPLPNGQQRWGRVLGQGVVATAPLVGWRWVLFSSGSLETQPLAMCDVLFIGSVLVAAGLLWRWRPSLSGGLLLGLLAAFVLSDDATSQWRGYAGLARYREAQEKGTLQASPPRIDPDPSLVYDHADVRPVVLGGRDSLRAELSRRLHPVWLARNDHTAGRLHVRYTVTTAGQAATVSARGPMLIYDNEAAQVLKDWAFVPGQRHGKAAAVWDTVSIVFREPVGSALSKRVE